MADPQRAQAEIAICNHICQCSGWPEGARIVHIDPAHPLVLCTGRGGSAEAGAVVPRDLEIVSRQTLDEMEQRRVEAIRENQTLWARLTAAEERLQEAESSGFWRAVGWLAACAAMLWLGWFLALRYAG